MSCTKTERLEPFLYGAALETATCLGSLNERAQPPSGVFISDLKMKGTKANRINHTHTSTPLMFPPLKPATDGAATCQMPGLQLQLPLPLPLPLPVRDDGDLAPAAGRNPQSHQLVVLGRSRKLCLVRQRLNFQLMS